MFFFSTGSVFTRSKVEARSTDLRDQRGVREQERYSISIRTGKVENGATRVEC